MKTTTSTLIALLALITTLNAQTQKGDLYLGGNFGYFYSSDGNAESKSNSLIIGPSIDYYVKDNLACGFRISYSGYSTTYTQNYSGTEVDLKNSSNLINFSPYIRLHGKLSDKVSCYGEAGLNFGFGKNTEESYDIQNNSTLKSKTGRMLYGIGISPGIWWNIKPKLALTFQYGSLYYYSSKYTPENDAEDSYKTSTFNFSLNGNSLGIGLHYAICGK